LDDRAIAERGQHLQEEKEFMCVNSEDMPRVDIDFDKRWRWVNKGGCVLSQLPTQWRVIDRRDQIMTKGRAWLPLGMDMRCRLKGDGDAMIITVSLSASRIPLCHIV
jgi:hypothetical protein